MYPTKDDILARHDRAFAVVDAVVDQVEPNQWEAPSPNPGWTARQVLAHLMWGQQLVTAWAREEQPPAPGVDILDGTDPDTITRRWHAARRELRSQLTPEVLDRVVTTRNFGSIAIGDFLWTFPNDALLHAWDLAVATGATVAIPDDLSAWFLEWGHAHEATLRQPGGLGPQHSVPDDADITSRWLAFAGRNPDQTAHRSTDSRHRPEL